MEADPLNVLSELTGHKIFPFRSYISCFLVEILLLLSLRKKGVVHAKLRPNDQHLNFITQTPLELGMFQIMYEKHQFDITDG